MAGFDEGDVIDVGSELFEMLAYPRPAFPVPLEAVGGFHKRTGCAEAYIDFRSGLLGMVSGQLGLGIEGVHGARPAFHEQPDDGSGFCGKARRRVRPGTGGGGWGGQELFAPEQRGKGQHAEALTRGCEKMAAVLRFLSLLYWL